MGQDKDKNTQKSIKSPKGYKHNTKERGGKKIPKHQKAKDTRPYNRPQGIKQYNQESPITQSQPHERLWIKTPTYK